MKKHSAQYKSSAFCLLFNEPDKLRSLYNALTGSSYGEETPVTITTLKNELTVGLRNDISFTIGDKTIVLLEHQSTINPNMPLRFLLYVATIFENRINRRDLYSKQKMKIPQPEFYLFYNGISDFPDKTTLKLSDSFAETDKEAEHFLDLKVIAYNINVGYNKELMDKIRDLDEYARFVDVVRKKRAKETDLEEAFRLAIKECIDNNILRDFLEKYGEEVMNSLLNISWEEYVEIHREEAREEEKLETAQRLKAMGLSPAQISEGTGLSQEKVEKL